MEVYDQNGEATLPRTTTGLTENNIYIDYYKKKSVHFYVYTDFFFTIER